MLEFILPLNHNQSQLSWHFYPANRSADYDTMNNLTIRTAAIIFHALLNIFIVSYLMDYDISSSWLAFLGFVLLLLVLLLLFIRHLLSFIHFIKSTYS